METFTEAIRLAPSVYLQASPQKFRLHRLLAWDVAPCTEVLQETGDINVTRQLMAGAFYAGFTQCSSDEKIADDSVTTTAPSLLRHIFSLADPTRRRTPLRPPCAAWQNDWRRAASTRPATYCLHVADEESGHDTLALMDLAALGLPAQEFVAHLRPK